MFPSFAATREDPTGSLSCGLRDRDRPLGNVLSKFLSFDRRLLVPRRATRIMKHAGKYSSRVEIDLFHTIDAYRDIHARANSRESGELIGKANRARLC
jgi:hypothetical protein